MPLRRLPLIAAALVSCCLGADGPAKTFNVVEATIPAMRAAMEAGRLTSRELVMLHLARIGLYEDKLHCVITVNPHVLQEADERDRERAQGRIRGPLHGIPIALKDLFDTAGVRTTAASAVFADRVPSEDAEVVRRLKMAGAVVLGKLNMHEFAYGDSSAQSHYGPVRNPWT